GRGRGANTWWSDAGTLTATFALPAQPAHPPQELPLRVGVATRRALSRWIDHGRLQIKWPNDVLADGRKLAGVLCEHMHDADVVGIGVNVNTDLRRAPDEVRQRAVSMRDLIGRAVTLDDVFIELA